MSESKITEGLARNVAAAAEAEQLEVVIELEDDEEMPAGTSTQGPGPSRRSVHKMKAPSRAERIARLKQSFQSSAESVERHIEAAGGETTGRVWLNRTVKARIPKHAVDTLSTLRSVRRLDSSTEIEPDEK